VEQATIFGQDLNFFGLVLWSCPDIPDGGPRVLSTPPQKFEGGGLVSTLQE
jgi:hypothetical protein